VTAARAENRSRVGVLQYFNRRAIKVRAIGDVTDESEIDCLYRLMLKCPPCVGIPPALLPSEPMPIVRSWFAGKRTARCCRRLLDSTSSMSITAAREDT
jgi:hypothetical protein